MSVFEGGEIVVAPLFAMTKYDVVEFLTSIALFEFDECVSICNPIALDNDDGGLLAIYIPYVLNVPPDPTTSVLFT